MNVSQFLQFNDRCPVCDTNLTTYMYVDSGSLWRANRAPNVVAKGEYQFRQFMLTEKVNYSSDDYMTLYDLGNTHNTRFNTSRLGLDSKDWKLYFFKICGNKAINDNKVDFDINWYDACYHRTSPWYQFSHHPDESKKWQLELTNPLHADMLNRDESFVFTRRQDDGLERTYFLNLNTEDKKTKFYYYTTTTKERGTADFEPKFFEIENLPLLKYRPDFSLANRRKLLDKFDTWITFS
jgi:hypothetical protein